MQKVMALRSVDLMVACAFVDMLYAMAYAVAITSSHSFCPMQPGWYLLTCLLGALPSGLVRIASVVLRWVYGYARGVGGARIWRKSDTVYGVVWIIVILCAIMIVITTPWSAGAVVSRDYKMYLLAEAVADAMVLLWILRKAWKDYHDWKKVEFHGVYAWSFQDFVKERFRTYEATGYADF